MAARPDTLNHNIETVRRVFRRVRPRGDYDQSLELLARAKALAADGVTKSGMMVGLGEREDGIFDVMADMRDAGVDIVTIGQYLRPSAKHLPVERYYPPAEFQPFVERGRELGAGVAPEVGDHALVAVAEVLGIPHVEA